MPKTKRKMAYLGPQGSFTHEAAIKRFPGARYELMPKPTLGDVFASAFHGESDYAVLPVENSSEGIIGVTYHELVDQGVNPKVTVQGEIYHPIAHNLAATSSAGLDQVKFVHTKDQAWGQCRKWVTRYLPRDVEFVEEPSTSKAAQNVKKHAETGRVAICGRLAVEIHGLTFIAQNIEDQHSNTTRFFIIGSRPLDHGKKDRPHKVTLAMVLLDRVGAIAEAFAVLKEANVDVRTVKVSPVRAEQIMAWKDWFFVDVAASDGDLSSVDQAIQAMRSKEGLVLTIRELGRYPCAESEQKPKRTAEQGRIPKDLTLESVIAASEGGASSLSPACAGT